MDPKLEQNTNESTTMSEFLSAFGVSEPAAVETPATTPEVTDETKPEVEVPATEEIPAVDEPAKPEQTATPVVQPQVDKAAQAFAAMRIQNSKYQNTIKGVASILGVDGKNPDDIIAAIQQKVVEAQAKQQGVPTELLTRLQQLEQDNQKHTQEEVQRNAYVGFQTLKDKFTLDDNALQAFAAQLATDGLNPFEKSVNVVQEYITRNYESLLLAAEKRGSQAEIARATKASQHSATVTDKDGQPITDPERISTNAQLTALLNTLG